jgi:amino acid adenylation domain-containing protein
VEYATDLFDQGTIERFAGNFKTLLEAVVVEADRPISELPLLSEAERRLLLEEWNETEAKYPSGLCIHELFEEQVWKTPDAVAVIYEDGWLSYRELNVRANRLAHHLRELGVEPDVRVALCLERGIEMVVSLLATLKAGGAYVPLDTAYPPERLAYMLEDSAPAVLLTHDAARKALAGLAGDAPAVPVLNFDHDAAQWASQSERNPSRAGAGLNPRGLAYVIYTSGSTGLPKGVMVEHRGLCNLAFAQIGAFDVNPESRVLQFSSFSFDACIFELTMTLCRGASLVLPPRGLLLAGEALIRTVEQYAVSHATLTPAVLAALPQDATMDSIRVLVVAGEAVTREAVQRWSVGRRFVNAYGPTETTVWATQHECHDDRPGAPPIGRPIANARIYILDLHRQPVPIGVAGEIYIGGAGVARGYLNRPELTEERFLRDPFSAEPEARMYKTGDLGRWLPDGTIEYLGRNDQQVKIRGYRIELGEIEARLAEHASVGEAVVIARDDNESGKRLVAYYTGEEAGAESLRAHLLSTLPEYMAPAAFVFLSELPLNPNGKLDRKALPAPDLSKQLERQYEEPRTPVEQILCAIWEQILGVERVGIHHNFFELGGHSLTMMRVHHRVQQELAKKFSLMAMFEHSTITSLATYLINNNPELHSYEEANLRATDQRERRRRQREQRKLRLSSLKQL